MISNVALLLLVASTVNCDFETELVGRLKTPRYGTRSIYDNSTNSIFVIGGRTEGYTFYPSYYSDVFQFTLDTGTLSKVAQLPVGLEKGGIGSDTDGSIFYFQGLGASFYNNYDIFKITPQNPTPVSVGKLSTLVFNQGTGNDGHGNMYMLHFGNSRTILRYNGRTGEVFSNVTELPPKGMSYMCQDGWHVDSVYFFGTMIGPVPKQIIKFTPSTEEIVHLEIEMPEEITGAQVVSDGTYIYLIGGSHDNHVLQFDPTNGDFVSHRLPNAEGLIASGHSAVYVEHEKRIYVIGGSLRYDLDSDAIFYIQLP